MSTDYTAVMDAILAELAIVAPKRKRTREYLDFAQHKDEDLHRGVITLLPGGVDSYPYEHRPGDCGQFQVVIAVQGRLPETCTGVQIDAAEFAALNQLEALAAREFERPDLLAALTLLSASQSAQLEKPYWWVMTRWEVFAPNG